MANDDPDDSPFVDDFADVYIVRSDDNGLTWTNPSRIDSGPFDTLQLLPNAAVDPVSGSIVVTYYDNRNWFPDNSQLDLYATRSGDGGNSWSVEVQLNDAVFDTAVSTTCDQLITVADFDPPVIEAPGPIGLECNGPAGVPSNDPVIQNWANSVTAADDCSDAQTDILCARAERADTNFEGRTYTITVSAQDECTNQAEALAMVIHVPWEACEGCIFGDGLESGDTSRW